VQEKEKEAKAKKLKEARERKQQEKDTVTLQKSYNTLNKGNVIHYHPAQPIIRPKKAWHNKLVNFNRYYYY
jgi:hypothetical protein